VPGERDHHESETVVAGSEAVLACTPWGAAGMTICYDLRFPELYRALALAGARLVFAPSAFTATTGAAHWETLVRARAIENQCVVLAPAQVGRHSSERASHGHSLVVDPWGEILAEGGDEEATLSATIDMTRVDDIRRRMPCLAHGRPGVPVVGGGPPAGRA
jgi:predicted amidohydrolase